MAVLKGTLSFGEAKFLANTLYNYYRFNKCPSSDCDLLKRFFIAKTNVLLRNKVLTSLGKVLNECCMIEDDLIEFRSARHDTYLNECKNLSMLLDMKGIKHAIIKTLRPFPADINDIDLIVKKEYKERTIKALKDNGYIPRKESIEQDLWTKVVNGIVVDVEIHTNIAISGFSYIESEFIFNNIRHENGIFVLDRNLEVILEAAHSVIKDLEIRLSDIINTVMYLDRYEPFIDPERVINLSRHIGLTIPLFYTINVASLFNYKINFINDYNSYPLLVFRRTLSMPLKPDIMVLFMALVEKTIAKTRILGIRKTLKQLYSITKSRGTDAIVTYFMNRSVTKKVFEDRVERH